MVSVANRELTYSQWKRLEKIAESYPAAKVVGWDWKMKGPEIALNPLDLVANQGPVIINRRGSVIERR